MLHAGLRGKHVQSWLKAWAALKRRKLSESARMATDREKSAICRIMAKIASPCIVELGARTGEEEAWLRDACGEDPHYVMVEPDMWNAQKILDHPRGLDQNRKVILGAVANDDGAELFIASCSPDGSRNGSRTSGSLRQPTDAHLCKYPTIEFTDVTVVPSWRLDTIFRKDWLTKIDLLWVDIQGYEREMILGGRQALERTRYLFMEVEDQEMYKGQALRGELLAMLPGWNLVEDFGENVLMHNPHMVEGRI
jgi:FkbM family methyltransferase